jgi:hypothetical protein
VKISREKLIAEAGTTGFRTEVLEKVVQKVAPGGDIAWNIRETSTP